MNGTHRKRWIAIGAGILMAAWFTAGWIRDTRLPKLTFEPRPFRMSPNGDDRVLRVVIHNDTSNTFRYEFRHFVTPGPDYVRIDCRFQESSGWSEPYYVPELNERGTRYNDLLVTRKLGPGDTPASPGFRWREGVLAPGQIVEGKESPASFFFRLRPPTTPFQVGIRLEKPVSPVTEWIDGWFGRWLPDSFGKPREVWVWSETITP